MTARSVVLSFASIVGMESSRLHELSLVMGQLWEEVAYSPRITHTSVRTAFVDDAVRLEVEGTGDGETLDDESGGWSSLLTSQVVRHLTHDVSLQRSSRHLRIEAVFPLVVS